MENSLIKPQKLKAGDKVAAVSLSWGGPGAFPQRYQAGKRQLEEAFDVQVVEMPHTLSNPDWLSSHPQARADDLMQAFSDDSIKAIFTTIGGDDSIRILPYLDLDLMRANPKIFMGYSDTTIMAGFAENGGLFPYMTDSVRKTLFSTETVGRITANTSGWTAEHLDWADSSNQSIKRKLQPSDGWHFIQGKGLHNGHLMGGCVEVLDWLRGTDLWPEQQMWDNAVLFLETSEEAPSPQMVKRMLRSLAAMGVFENAAGFLFGRPGGDVPSDKFVEYDQAIKQVLVDEQGLTHIPIITRMDFGHTDPMMILPYGAAIRIDCGQKEITIPERTVVD